MTISAPATYGTAAVLAGQLDLRDEQRILHESLEEEKKVDLLLTQLAKREVIAPRRIRVPRAHSSPSPG